MDVISYCVRKLNRRSIADIWPVPCWVWRKVNVFWHMRERSSYSTLEWKPGLLTSLEFISHFDMHNDVWSAQLHFLKFCQQQWLTVKYHASWISCSFLACMEFWACFPWEKKFMLHCDTWSNLFQNVTHWKRRQSQYFQDLILHWMIIKRFAMKQKRSTDTSDFCLKVTQHWRNQMTENSPTISHPQYPK